MPPSSMNDLFAFLSDLMTQNAALFQTVGANMFRGFAVILIVWFGLKSALASAGAGQGPLFHFDHFASLLLTIAFGFAMINYYAQPIPGFGVSFYHLIIDEGLNLSNQLNNSLVQNIWDRLSGLYWGLEMPVLSLNILGNPPIRRDRSVPGDGPGGRVCRDRFRLHCSGRGRAARPHFHSVFHRSSHGMALLGMAQEPHPIRLLPRRRERLLVRFREPAHSFCGRPPRAVGRRYAGRPVLSAGTSTPGVHLRDFEDSFACEFALYGPFGRGGYAQRSVGRPMTDTPRDLPMKTDERAARRQYVEQFGSLIVMNTYLKIALLALCLVALALAFLNVRTYQAFRELKPLVIRISDVGRAEAVRYESLEYHPQEAEIRYFLTQFVELYYSRMRATVRESYARSFYFLDPRLADALIDADRKSKDIEQFLSGASDDVDVHVKNVSIEDLRQSPYRATVEFEKVYYGADRVETRRERYVGNFVFTFKDRVPNAVIPVNPLGLVITYFREDEAFQP